MVGDFIYKVSNTHRTTPETHPPGNQSLSEAAKWELIKDSPDRKYFAEVIGSGLTACRKYYWIAQKRYEFDKNTTATPENLTIVNQLALKWKIGDIDRYRTSFGEGWEVDGDHPNWGLIKGEPLIFDYGVDA